MRACNSGGCSAWKGAGGYPEAHRYLLNAQSVGSVPELDLAFGHYFETKENPDFFRAQKYYLKAAIQGRLQGFFGYSRISRRLRQNFRAIAVDALRICLIPILLVLLGSKASKGF